MSQVAKGRYSYSHKMRKLTWCTFCWIKYFNIIPDASVKAFVCCPSCEMTCYCLPCCKHKEEDISVALKIMAVEKMSFEKCFGTTVKRKHKETEDKDTDPKAKKPNPGVDDKKKIQRQKTIEDFMPQKEENEKLKSELLKLSPEERAQMIAAETDPTKKKALRSIAAYIKRLQEGNDNIK